MLSEFLARANRLPNMADQIQAQDSSTEPLANTGIASVYIQKRRFGMFIIEDHELDTLKAGYVSLHLPIMGICIGAAIGLGTAAYNLSKTDSARPWFGVGALFSFLLILFFGECARRERKKCNTLVEQKIRPTKRETQVEYEITETISDAK
jgi:hypothetical protein